MTRKKKARTGGPIGVTKSDDDTLSAPRTSKVSGKKSGKHPRPDKGKGRPAGSRQQSENSNHSTGHRSAKTKDPRIGSKRPITLDKPVQPKGETSLNRGSESNIVKEKQDNPLSWKQELAALEQDQNFISGLEAMEQGQVLPAAAQQKLEVQLERYEWLLDKLNITVDDDPMDSLSQAGNSLKKDWW